MHTNMPLVDMIDMIFHLEILLKLYLYGEV